MKAEIVSLYRYYLMMRHMQSRFLHDRGGGDWHIRMADNPQWTGFLAFVDPPSIHLALWQAMLYVVIEGWTKLGLSDPKLDELLKSKNVAQLKLHRHGTFHFHPDLTPRLCRRLLSSPDAVEWTHHISDAFHEYFSTVSKSREFMEQVKKETRAESPPRTVPSKAAVDGCL